LLILAPIQTAPPTAPQHFFQTETAPQTAVDIKHTDQNNSQMSETKHRVHVAITKRYGERTDRDH
jgi:hypothetical protein